MGYWLYIKPDEAGKYKKNGYKIEQTRTGTYKVWMEGDKRKFGIKFKKNIVVWKQVKSNAYNKILSSLRRTLLYGNHQISSV
jgi:hypothetical protein